MPPRSPGADAVLLTWLLLRRKLPIVPAQKLLVWKYPLAMAPLAPPGQQAAARRALDGLFLRGVGAA